MTQGNKSVNMHYFKGNFYEILGKPDLAMQKFKEAAEAGYDKAQMTLGDLYKEKNEIENAEYWYKAAFVNGVNEAAFQIGNMYYDNKIYDTSLYWYELAAQKNHLPAKNNLGVVYYLLEDYDSAERTLKEAADEGFAKAYFNLGLLNFEMGNEEISELMYREGANRNDDDAIYNLAVIEMERANYTPAMDLFKRLFKQKNIKACINFGVLAEISGDDEFFEDIEKAYLIAADTGDPLAQYQLAHFLAKNGKEMDAIHYYEKAIAQGHALAAFRLANLYNKLDDTDNAIIFYKMAIQRGIIEAKNNLGCIYFENKKYNDAGTLFKEAVDEGCLEAAENLGDVCHKLKDDNHAIYYYGISPNTISAQIKMGTIYESNGQLDKAATWYKKAADSGDIDTCCKLAGVYYKLKKKKAAVRYYKVAAAHEHDLAKLYLGKIYFEEGHYLDSKNYLETPAELSNIFALNTIGIIYENYIKDTKKAMEYYEKAIKLNCTEAMYNLAQLLFRNSETEKGIEYLKMGSELGNKKCEYFLAAYYFKKSTDMFTNLAMINYANTRELIKEVKKLEFIEDNLLLTNFDISPLEYENKDDGTIEALYILETNENITQYLNGREIGMAVDQGKVENLDI